MLLLLFTSIFLVSCKSNTKPVEKETYMMGTVVQLKIYGENSEKATEQSLKKISDIENKMSVNIKTSELTKLNAKAGISGEKLSQDTYSVIEKAVSYSKLTEGALDVTMEPIVKLWGIGTDKERVPLKNEIQEKLKLVNYKDITPGLKDSFNLTNKEFTYEER